MCCRSSFATGALRRRRSGASEHRQFRPGHRRVRLRMDRRARRARAGGAHHHCALCRHVVCVRIRAELRPAVLVPLRRGHRPRREIPVASTYISEILRAQRRGSSFLAYQMIFPVGLLGAALAGAAVVPSFGWRWMFIIGAVPALIALVLRHFCPESPRWLACKGRLREADEVVTHIERIVSRNGAQPLPPLPQINARPAASKTRLCELFAGRYARRTLLVWVVWASSYIISTACRAGYRRSTARSIISRCSSRLTMRSPLRWAASSAL